MRSFPTSRTKRIVNAFLYIVTLPTLSWRTCVPRRGVSSREPFADRSVKRTLPRCPNKFWLRESLAKLRIFLKLPNNSSFYFLRFLLPCNSMTRQDFRNKRSVNIRFSIYNTRSPIFVSAQETLYFHERNSLKHFCLNLMFRYNVLSNLAKYFFLFCLYL